MLKNCYRYFPAERNESYCRRKNNGSEEELKLREKDTPRLKPHEVLVKLHAIGVNYIDIYHRTGLYPQMLPFTPGVEGAGIVEEVGEACKLFRKGDRVAYYAGGNLGAYAEYHAVPEELLVALPDAVSMEQAAAVMLQGMTAHYLVHSTYSLKPGETALIHAAAGGVGIAAGATCQDASGLILISFSFPLPVMCCDRSFALPVWLILSVQAPRPAHKPQTSAILTLLPLESALDLA